MAYHDPHAMLQDIIDRHPAIFALLHEAVLLGWRSASLDMDGMARAPLPLRLRTRRNIANDYAVGYARKLLDPFDRVKHLQWIDEAETLTLRLGSRYAVRFKKTDRQGKVSSIPTSRQKRIANAGQMLLFGITEDDLLLEEEIWLTIGWVPDDLDDQIEGVGLTVGDGRFGLHALDRADDSTLARLAPESWPLVVEARKQLA